MKKPSRKRKRARKPVGLSREQLHDFYLYMALTRAIEDRIQLLYRQNKVVGGVYSSRGQEAISIGSAFALKKGDYLAPMIRNLGAVLVRGISSRDVMANYLARATGPTRGKDNSQHFGKPEEDGLVSCISMLGTLIPVMSGLALASKLKKLGRVALTYIGEGGSSTGAFHEGLNFAAVQNVPFVLIIENNQWSYATHVSVQTKLENLADRAAAYGIPGYIGDGNDVLEVYRLTKKAVDDARAGKGPAIIEFKTMRMRGHAVHDDADYVPKELLEAWERKDPIRRYVGSLQAEGLLSDDEKETLDRKIEADVEDATKFALESSMPPGEDVWKGVFADDSIVRFTPWWETQ